MQQKWKMKNNKKMRKKDGRMEFVEDAEGKETERGGKKKIRALRFTTTNEEGKKEQNDRKYKKEELAWKNEIWRSKGLKRKLFQECSEEERH